MTRSDIIKLVDTLTENRASKILDMNALFNLRIQRFCQEQRFWWREKTGNFTTVAGTGIYDLTSTSYGSMTDLDEIIQVLWVNNASTGDVTELMPVFDPQARLIESLKTDTSGTPATFFIEKNTFSTIHIRPIPASALNIYVVYWAIPQFTASQSDETIPIVPAQYHHALVSGLKMDVFEYLFGTESQKYLVAVKEYADGVFKAQTKPAFSVEKVTEFRSRENAVRAT